MIYKYLIMILSILVLISSCTTQSNNHITGNSVLLQSAQSDPVDSIVIKWRVLHAPVDYFLQAAQSFKEEIEQLSNGELTVEIIAEDSAYSTDTITPYAEEMIMNGTTDMMQIYIYDLFRYNPDLKILSTPNLFSTDEHVDNVVDGQIGDELLNGIDNPNLKGLAFTFSGGFVNFVSLVPNLKSLSDLQGQRFLDFDSNNLISNELGLISTMLKSPDSRVPLDYGIDEGLFDVWEQTAQDALGYLESGTTKSIINSRHSVIFTALMINNQFFDSLSLEHQQIVQQSAKNAALVERHSISSDGKKVLSRFSDRASDLSSEDIKTLERIKTKFVSTRLNNVNLDILRKIESSRPSTVLEQEELASDPIVIQWRVLHPPVDYFIQAAETFKASLEQLSNGELTVNIIAPLDNNIPDSVADHAERMILNGTTDMMQMYIGNLNRYNPDLKILSTPNLFSTDEHVDNVVDGQIGDELLNGIDNPNLKGLAFTFSGGFVNFVSQLPDVKRLSDIKGKRARISDLKTKIYSSELGFLSIDGEDTPRFLQEVLNEDLAEVWEQTAQDSLGLLEDGRIKSIINSRHSVIFTALMINNQFFDSLSLEHQQIVQQAAKEAAFSERHAISSDGEKVLARFSDRVSELSPEDIETLEVIKANFVSKELKNSNLDILRKIEESKT